ncbi:NAD(+)/NADH kinase [Salipiger bermudensis]|uniref:diacylglycerol/lipid kinase family protein n=1 Tax=Salipiger bermudensis TaxID=344736 RepID=UPI001C9A14D1|nr:diacylglycerol kinase family protein [Salipiger bermudensis]MBY6003887.1 NAD(+)/NADH kinase [Salipiger bermudensis]
MRKVCVILNERSGDHSEGDRRARLSALFDQAGISADIAVPKGKLDLVAFARRALEKSGAEMLIAAGGDGTIGAVAAASHDAGVPMGVIPQGTFNYFARGLNIPEDMDGAVEVVATGQLHDMPLGEVNGEVFLNNASLGVYPLILHRRESIYNRWGRSRLAAYWSVLLALTGFRRPLKLRITLDGREEKLRTPLAFVANSAYQLERFNLDGADAIRDGRFALFTAKGERSIDLVRTALKLAGGAAQKGSDFDLATARDITIHTGRKRTLVARDGEKALMETPIRIRLRDKPLRVMVPKDGAGE